MHTLTGIHANLDRILALKEKGKLKHYRVLHFAVHGLFVDGNASLNALVLSLPEMVEKHNAPEYKTYRQKYGSFTQDGYLRFSQVKSLNLDADLVVLSACETSLGHELGGEGMVVGLPQAFLIGGSRNVVASLWAVDDEATSMLMQIFYKYILQNKLKPALALKKAQEDLRTKEIDFKDPYYWAAFVVYGD